MNESVYTKLTVGRLEKNIAKLYIFFLTLRMISPLVFTQSIFHAAAANFDFVLHIMGILLILIRNHGVIYFYNEDESRLLKFFGAIVLVLNASSLIMACFMQGIYGSIGNDSAFSAISGMLIYWFQYVFIFFYNKEVFSFLAKDEIESVLQAEMWGLLILGYIQIGVMMIGALGGIYDKLDIFLVLKDSGMTKLALTGSEGAAGGAIIGIFVIPFLVSGVLNKKKHLSELVQIILWIPVLFFTNSSTAYLVTLSIIPVLLVIVARRGLLSKSRFIAFVIICGALIGIFLARNTILNLFPQDILSQLRYLIFEKAQNQNDGSTVSRTIPLITNWGAFKEFPILGVGNGCQGYFYTKYFPSWAMNKAGSDVMSFYHMAEQGIVNGAVFFPSILSGYGIVGMILVICYIVKSHRVLKKKRGLIGRFYDYYFLACLPILLCGFQGELAGEYYIWFVLSMPYIIPDIMEVSDGKY